MYTQPRSRCVHMLYETKNRSSSSEGRSKNTKVTMTTRTTQRSPPSPTHFHPTMTQKLVAAVTFAAVLRLCAGDGVVAEKVDINSQLRGLDVPEGLKEVIVSMVTEVDELKKDRDALENKTQVMEAELRREKQDMAALRIEVIELRGALDQFTNQNKKDIQQITCDSITARQKRSRRLWSAAKCRSKHQLAVARQWTACSRCAASRLLGTGIGCKSLWAAIPCR